MKYVYIAAPFSGDELTNIIRASRIAAMVNVAGEGKWSAVCPHTMNNLIGLEMTDMGSKLDDDYWYESTCGLMLRCDAMILSPEWRGSQGCRQEVDEAFAHKIPCVPLIRDFQIDDVRSVLNWLEGEIQHKIKHVNG